MTFTNTVNIAPQFRTDSITVSTITVSISSEFRTSNCDFMINAKVRTYFTCFLVGFCDFFVLFLSLVFIALT